MEAANRGAREAGGKTIGLNIRLPFEQGANPFITDGLHFEFHYFFMRKFWFAYLAKALVIFPGGFGTCDELFEILTLVQTDKLSKKIGVILYGREFWDEVIDFKPFAEWGAIAEQDMDLIHFADTPAEAFELLRTHLTTHLGPASGQEAVGAGHRADATVRRLSVQDAGGRVGWVNRWTHTLDRKLIDQYKDGYRVVTEALAGATEAELDAHPAPGKWSAREIVHHLADSEMTSAIRLRLLLATDRPAIAGYDENVFARRLHYDRPIDASLDALRAAQAHDGRDSGPDERGRLVAGRHAQRQRPLHDGHLA